MKEAEEILRDTGSREGDEVGVCDKEAEEELKGSSQWGTVREMRVVGAGYWTRAKYSHT